MGDVIYLQERLAARKTMATGEGVVASEQFAARSPIRITASAGRPIRARLSAAGVVPQDAAFFFQLSSPFSYLAAERIERMLGEVSWVPCAPLAAGSSAVPEELIAAAEREADLLRLPLVMPDSHPQDLRRATRAAAWAAANGDASRFALAAFRLAFCGGFDLDDPRTLAEAGAAAGLSVRDLLASSEDPRWDLQPAGAARGLIGHGISATPAIRVANRWFEGVDAVGEASLFTTFRIAHGAAGL